MIAAALQQLEAAADPARAASAAARHKAQHRYLGVPGPQIDALVAQWRAAASLDQRMALAAALWDSNIFDARLAAAKLLTQARLRPDDAAWALVQTWVADFDGAALADHACKAIDRRLLAKPARLDTVEGWVTHPNPWARRAALVATLPWTKQNHPTPEDRAIRDRVLGWAATLAPDRAGMIQMAIAGWLRDLSRHDPARTCGFLAQHGATLHPMARAEAARLLPTEA